jgi:hypothetical protein
MAISRYERTKREKARAKAARVRYELEKKRSAAARKGVRTKNQPDNLFQAMINALTDYKDGHKRRDYSRFRALKRKLYKVAPTSAEGWCADAADAAGWDLQASARFAKLS